MEMFADIVTYAVWYVMVFFSVVWIMVYLHQGKRFHRDPKPPSVLPAVSIIVPAYNEEETIAATVHSLFKLDYPKNRLEVVIVNDGSKDKTSRIAHELKTEYRNLKVIDKSNGGKATALNAGIAVANGELVACMDADSFVDPGALKMMVGYFKKPACAAVTSSMKIKNKDTLLARVQAVEYVLNIFLRKILTFMDALPVTPGPFSVYRKSVVWKLGGFEGGHLVEDMDMAFKLHWAGYKIENSVDARVWTICPDTLGGVYKQRVRWYRGLIGTSFKYKQLFFNPQYGNLGMFFLPLNFSSIVLVFFLLTLMVHSTVVGTMSTVWYWSLVNFDFAYLISTARLPDLSILLMDYRTVLMTTITALGISMLYLSFRQSNEPLRGNLVGFITYLFIFPIFLMVFWSMSMFYELRRAKKDW